MKSNNKLGNRRQSLLQIFLIAGILLFSAFESAAQETAASIYGTITDPNKAVVAGAQVTARNEATGITRTAASNADGYYIIPLLPAGTYTLTVETNDFAPIIISGVQHQVSINSNVPVALRLQAQTEQVEVQADTNTVDSSTSTLAYSVTNEQVRGLPVITSAGGRSVLSTLPLLVPGVKRDFYSISEPGTGGRGDGLSINGGRSESISYNFDGGDNNDGEYSNAASQMPNPDAIDTFTVVTNNYSADLGRSGGGVINVTTRSGTDKFSGNARYYLKNEALNARSFFDPERPLDRLNTFGGSFGGPLSIPYLYSGKAKTHFFADYEQAIFSSGQSYSIIVPTLAERSGNFSQSIIPGDFLIDPETGEPFDGNVIPQARFNPIARQYLNRFIPVPNQGSNQYVRERVFDQSNRQFTLRLDHNLTTRDTLSGTYFINKRKYDTDNSGYLDGRSLTRDQTQNFVARYTRTFAPNVVNQFLVTYIRSTYDTTNNSSLAEIQASELGFTNIKLQTDAAPSAPVVRIAGTGVDGLTNIYFSTKQNWQIKDDLVWIKGNHSFKFGADARRFIYDRVQPPLFSSFFEFSALNGFGTGNGIADFLLGVPNQYVQETGNEINPRQSAYYFYGLDDWKIKPNLTLNLGVRYELVPPVYDRDDRLNVFRAGAQSKVIPQAPAGLLFVGDPDPVLGTVPRGVYQTDKNNIAPRLGLAWSPRYKSGFLGKLFGDEKTAIRLGAGVFYDQTYGFSATQYAFTQPFNYTVSLPADRISDNGGNFANPFGSSANPFPIPFADRPFIGLPDLQPFAPDFKSAYIYQYNLSLQRQLPGNLLLELAYVGSNSFKLNRERQINFAPIREGSSYFDINDRRIYQGFSDIFQQESSGRARYDAGQGGVFRRFLCLLAHVRQRHKPRYFAKPVLRSFSVGAQQ